jgi:cell division protein FtsN
VSRDFATKTGKKTNNSRKNSRGESTASPLKWLATGLVLGVGVALLVYFQLAGDKIPKVSLTPQPSTQTKNTKEFPAVEAPTEKEYEFWEMLKYKQIELPKSAVPKTTTDKPLRQYVMQCGSFKQQAMAEALKAKIAMVGFESTIHKTDEKDGFSWHRVVLGPYTSKRKAEANRHRLNESGVGGCRIW